jgi:hypothetical protein
LVSTVTVPPLCAPGIVTGPFAFTFLPLPVLPPLKCPDGPVDVLLPEPPHALRVNAPTADTAINAVLTGMNPPFEASAISRQATADRLCPALGRQSSLAAGQGLLAIRAAAGRRHIATG